MLNLEELLAQGRKLPWAEQEAHFTEVIESIPVVAPKVEETLIAELYNHRGRARRMQGNYTDSKADYQMALAITTDPDQRALARINLADVHRVGFKDFSQAHASLDEALTFIDNGTLIHAQAVDQRGLIFRAEGNYETAFACYRRAISICEELLSLDLKPNPDDQKSEEGSIKVLSSSSALEVMDRLVQVYQHRGEAAFELYKENREVSPLRLAIESEEKVMELSTKYQLPNSTNSVYNARTMLGLITLESGDAEQALNYQLSALDYAGVMGSQRSIGVSSLYVAECFYTLNKGQDAVTFLRIFCDRIADGSIPADDYSIIGPKVKNILRLCQGAGSSWLGFEELIKRFS